MNSATQGQIARAPESPGVYLFRNSVGKVLYVGKAKRLRDRLKAYLHPERDERPSMVLMVSHVESVEWLLTENEKEALILENSLIKEHRPRYNIMFRDDKSFVSLRLTKHSFPRLFITRKIVRDGSEYFGPYSSAFDLRQTLKLLQKLFMVRDCSDSFFAHRSRPCLRHQIKRCSAPCVNLVSPEAYAEQVNQVRLFLSGETTALIEKLNQQMTTASTDMRYEDAARIRDRLRAIDETLQPQQVESRQTSEDADALGLAGDQEATLLKVLKIRNGRLVSADEFFVSEPISAAPEITRAFVQQYYFEDISGREIPRQLLLSTPLADAKNFESLLSEKGGGKTKILFPKRGRLSRLLKLADRNAATLLSERKRRSDVNRRNLEDVERKLHLPRFPRRIEGYDISNFHGAQPVGSMVVFIDGEADKNHYRHYGIRDVKGSNDFAMLHEMFDRRFAKMTKQNRPDLVLVDGGKGQLRQVVDVLRELNIVDVPVASLAKERELISRSGRKFAPERVFLPQQKNPIVFPSSSPLLHLLQRVRDESHRFGITRHRKARNRTTLASELTRIPGVGPGRQKILLKSLGSLEQIRSTSVEELTQIKGISTPVAKEIYNYFRSRKDEENE